MFGVMAFVFPSHLDGAQLPCGWLNTCLPTVNELLVLLSLCVQISFLIKLCLSHPMSFLTFTLLILSPVQLAGQLASSCTGALCWSGLNQ